MNWDDVLGVDTGEMEGQQAIPLSSLNFCDPDNRKVGDFPDPYGPKTLDDINDILDSDTIAKLINTPPEALDGTGIDRENYAVIEFGQAHANGDEVDFELNVTPGQGMTGDTIIGSVVVGGERRLIRSIFESGEVMADGSGENFARLFPSFADRHIIIRNYEVGIGCDFRQEDIEEYRERMRSNTELYNLIKDNYVYAALPEILLKRESREDHYIVEPLLGYVPHTLLGLCPFSDGHEYFNDLIEPYEKRLEKFGDEIKELSSPDNVRGTRGNPTRTRALYDRIQAIREEILRWCVDYRREGVAKMKACRYDDDFGDCRYLAWGMTKADGGSATKRGFKKTEVGGEVYGNYYGTLLSRVHVLTGEKWSTRYYDLLSDIIRTRLSVERYSRGQLIREFNELYREVVDRSSRDGFGEVDSSTDGEYGNVYAYILAHYKDTDDGHATAYSQQLANLWVFASRYSDEEVPGAIDAYLDEDGEFDVMSLVREEHRKLSGFWDEAIRAYYSDTLENIVGEMEGYVASLNRYAEWPSPIEVPIGGRNYKIYTFANNDAAKRDYPDEDEEVPDLDDLTEPEQPTEIEAPTEQEARDALGKAAEDSDNDPDGTEPTICDTKYWQKYFAMATIASLPFLADGFDVPPAMTPTSLPGIYICFGSVYIKPINAVLVFGIGIRGIWPAPILMVVNLSSRPISGLTPLIVIMENVKNMFFGQIDKIEACVPNLAQMMIDKLETENSNYRRDIKKYEVYIDTLRNMRQEEGKLIKKEIEEYLHPDADHRQVITRMEKLVK